MFDWQHKLCVMLDGRGLQQTVGIPSVLLFSQTVLKSLKIPKE
jgi:hypothetical protein